MDKNCLSYWFPRIKGAGLPVPATIILESPDLLPLLDGTRPEGMDRFLSQLQNAGMQLGYPCFLRTGQGSGKHRWRDTCYIASPEDFECHVRNLVEWSHEVDFFGLPHHIWCVRELLATAPVVHAFEGMPICPEFRYFVRDGEVVCWHPYWPKDSLEEGFPIRKAEDSVAWERDLPPQWEQLYQHLCSLYELDILVLDDLARRAGKAVGGGSWSVDILETMDLGWYVTDMALAHQSYHWTGCEKAKEFTP